jgi:hypothetical protein
VFSILIKILGFVFPLGNVVLGGWDKFKRVLLVRSTVLDFVFVFELEIGVLFVPYQLLDCGEVLSAIIFVNLQILWDGSA